MDEPTNVRDMIPLELLEQAVQGYSGTVLLVSHDGTFVSIVVTRLCAALGMTTSERDVDQYKTEGARSQMHIFWWSNAPLEMGAR